MTISENLYRDLKDSYTSSKWLVICGFPNIASANITSSLYTLDALRFTSKDPEEVEFVKHLTGLFEGYDRIVISVANATVEGKKKSQEVWKRKQGAMMKIIKTIDTLLELEEKPAEKKTA